jgi:hypothetical protein
VRWRISGLWQKTLYIVLGYAAFVLLFLVLRTWLFSPHSWAYAVIALLGNLAYTGVGVRIFRGYLEPLAPPRPWWRWTGRPKAGFWLGALSLFAAVGSIQGLWPRAGQPANFAVSLLSLIGQGILAAGYFNSSFRLRRHSELWSQRRPKKSTRNDTSGIADSGL